MKPGRPFWPCRSFRATRKHPRCQAGSRGAAHGGELRQAAGVVARGRSHSADVLIWLLRGSEAVAETRKLAAILVSDVVGYSRLAGSDEDRILARLRTLRSDLIDPTIAVHH